MLRVGRMPWFLLQWSTRGFRCGLPPIVRIGVVGRVPRRHAWVLPWFGSTSCIVTAGGRCC